MYFKSNFKIIYKKNPLEVFQIKTHKSKNAQKYLGEWEYLFNVKQTKNLLFTKLFNCNVLQFIQRKTYFAGTKK